MVRPARSDHPEARVVQWAKATLWQERGLRAARPVGQARRQVDGGVIGFASASRQRPGRSAGSLQRAHLRTLSPLLRVSLLAWMGRDKCGML
jgi:hypothetical protein